MNVFKDIYKQDLSRFILRILSIFVLIFSVAAYYTYEGNFIIFFLYTLSINILFLFSTLAGPLIFIIFLLTWLGFWFKTFLVYPLNYYLGFNFNSPNFKEAIANFGINLNIEIVDQIMIKYTVVFFIISMLVLFFRRKENIFIFQYKNKLKFNENILFVLIAFLGVINFYLELYAKGFVQFFFENNNINLLYRFVYYVIPNFVLLSLLNSKKRSSNDFKRLIYIIILLNFILFTSMLSREFVLLAFLSFFFIYLDQNINNKKLFLVKLIFLVFILSFLNLKITSGIRHCKLDSIKNNQIILTNLECIKKIELVEYKEKIDLNQLSKEKYDNKYMLEHFKDLFSLFNSRWVGFESVYLAHLNFDFKSANLSNSNYTNFNFVPGIFYFIYSGSIYHLIFNAVAFVIILIIINQLLQRFSINCYHYFFFSYLIAYRIYHSGISFKNTIFFTVILILFSSIIKKITLNQNIKFFN